ncbi:MAG: homoserine dehydrogenase [Candidatus Melainabacteria bacterium]|nr:MAG: homoserine dehydrogenase [Candidatus Melainabacteria bacterium]
MSKIKLGLIGLGTVGGGVFKVLKNFPDVEITKIAVKNIDKPRNIDGLDRAMLTTDPYEIVESPEITVVAELIGGVHPAYELIKKAIENGKHVVTANKELLAKHGEELFNYAEQHNVVILYEAAIAGGIPLIMPIKTILAGNKITKIEAILNGTTNYILTNMDENQTSYESVLKEAQELGYAEADPTGDVEGFDSAYKLTTLATITFNKRVKLENVYREGITKVKSEDIKYANELGYKIKLVAYAHIDENDNADVRVHPMFVSKEETLAHINYVKNAVTLTGSPVGKITLSGAGAGEMPTASSVVGDILAIEREYGTTDYILPMMRCKHAHNTTAKMVPIDETENKYYLRLIANDKIGGIADITEHFAEKKISIESILMKEVKENNTAEIVIVTDKCKEKLIKELKNDFDMHSCVKELASMIRING